MVWLCETIIWRKSINLDRYRQLYIKTNDIYVAIAKDGETRLPKGKQKNSNPINERWIKWEKVIRELVETENI